MVSGSPAFLMRGGKRPRDRKICKLQKFVYNLNTTAGRFFRNTRGIGRFPIPRPARVKKKVSTLLLKTCAN